MRSEKDSLVRDPIEDEEPSRLGPQRPSGVSRVGKAQCKPSRRTGTVFIKILGIIGVFRAMTGAQMVMAQGKQSTNESTTEEAALRAKYKVRVRARVRA